VTVLCIGGACVDRKYLCIAQAQPGTSNPAHARCSFGGVARNVAENLARLGVNAALWTVVGDDETGAALLRDVQAAGVDTTLTMQERGYATCEYAAVIDTSGELLIGVADMSALERLSVDRIEQRWLQIERADWLFVDCNVSSDVLAYCIERCRTSGVRLAIDAVSERKVRKLPERIDGIDLLFLNEGEAAVYLGAKRGSASDVRARGAAAVILTRGERGIVVAQDAEAEIPAAPARCIDPTGAGDALVATTLFRLLQGDDLVQAARVGAVGAARTVESNESVRPDLLAWIAS
jgi:pseudouridine kinase